MLFSSLVKYFRQWLKHVFIEEGGKEKHLFVLKPQLLYFLKNET